MKRKYSLFRKDGPRKYTRISDLAFYKPAAIRIFQTALLNAAFTNKPLELRPVKD